MPNPWKDKVLAYNRKRKETEEKAGDMERLLSMIPNGIRKQLLKNEEIAAILQRHGYSE